MPGVPAAVRARGGAGAAGGRPPTACRAATAGSRSSPTSCCSASSCRRRRWTRAAELAERADLLLCVGSSLEVYPSPGCPSITLRAGGALAIVTQSATQYDDRAAVRLPATSSPSSRRSSPRSPASTADERRRRGRPAGRLGVAEQDARRAAITMPPSVTWIERGAHRDVEEALADPRDRDELDGDHGVGDRQRGREVGDEEGEGVRACRRRTSRSR